MKNYSQANQDLFVLECLNLKQGGKFLDLGCNDPIKISNTYLLENDFQWEGLCIDIDDNHIKKYKEFRKSKSFTKDCTKLRIDDLSIISSTHFDYLSLDLEPASITLECLKNLMPLKVEFSIITYEHDEYRFGKSIKEESRKIFQEFGYQIICKDVHNNHQGQRYNFEDWYVNYKYVNPSDVEHLICEGLDDVDIVKKFKNIGLKL